jgi:hypothetical protein
MPLARRNIFQAPAGSTIWTLRGFNRQFQHPLYRQAYEPFMPAMAAIDLLFCCGPEALTRLRDAKAGQKVVTAA